MTMDVTFFVAWEWFQWSAIRLALFLGLLTLGPSIGLIVFDLLLYAYRTTFDRVLFVKHKEMPSVSNIDKDRLGDTEVEVKDVEVTVQ